MQRWVQEIIKNSKLVDIRIGTVKQLDPIKLDIGDNKQITQFGSNLLFTEQVIEKRISLTHQHDVQTLTHTHANSAGDTTPGLSGSYSSENATMSFVITEGIKAGDKLLLIRALGGQQWIILSKLRDSNSLTINQDGEWEWG